MKNQTTLIAVDSAELEKSSPEALQKNEKILETKAQDTPETVEEPQKPSGENIQKKPVNKETVTDEPKDINQKLQDLQNQVDTLKELGRTREKLTATKEEKAEQEKSVLTAAGREYTLMQKGKFELDYSLRYSYISSSSIISASEVEPHANHTITNAIDVQYGLKNNITTDVNGLIPTFLNFGDLQIQTAGKEEKFIFHNIPDPYEVKNIIMNLHKSSEQKDENEFSEMLKEKIHHDDAV